MTGREHYIKGMEKGKLLRGKGELLAFLRGERLTQKQAIQAHCYDCQGGYSGGAEDCLSDICPLRPFMPYNPNRQKKTDGPSNEGNDATFDEDDGDDLNLENKATA